MHAPLFWKDKTRLSNLLIPASALYGYFARRHQAAPCVTLPVPVICIGNVVAGGSGKTPVALALGAMLKAQGLKPHYLSRGYKGRLKGPVRVNTSLHKARDVGDEPLLLAEALPTWVSSDRVKGAQAAIAAGAEMIIMDDGFQNPGLHKDVSLLIIDGSYGIGNGRLLPAGPLRETVESAVARATAVVIIGEDSQHLTRGMPLGLPVLSAKIEPVPQAQVLEGVAVVAFAGIARPRKFYRTLQQLGCDVRRMIAYPDHYAYKAKDAAFLRSMAVEYQAHLITTAKDHVRLPEALRAEVLTLCVEAVFEDPAALVRLVLQNEGG